MEKIRFRKIDYEFQQKLKSDIKEIKSSRKILTPADKTSIFYKLSKEEDEHFLHNSITKNYKIPNSNIAISINKEHHNKGYIQ